MKACTRSGKGGQECPLCDLGSELPKGGSCRRGTLVVAGTEKEQVIPGTWYACIHTQGSPSGYCWLEIQGMSQVEKGSSIIVRRPCLGTAVYYCSVTG